MYKYRALKENFQRQLFLGKINNLTNAGVIKSETEYKRYLNSLLTNLNQHNTQLFNAKNIDIKFTDIINFQNYRDNLELIYFDISTAYQELNNIKDILKNNLKKNQQFFRNIEERIRFYRNHLSLIKSNTYDVTISSNSFVETFFDYNKNFHLENCNVNPKTNKLALIPATIDEFNKSADIEKVDLEIIPTENRDGGVYYTHTSKNEIDKNYKTGSRDMMQNGLWKMQILTEGIPENYITINGNQRKYYGIIAKLDIYFNGQKPINRLFINPYGEFFTTILNVQYLNNNQWLPLRYNNTEEGTYQEFKGEKIVFDFRNAEPVSSNAIRIIFNQENYKTLDNYIFSNISAMHEIMKEIEENRYDFLNGVSIKNKNLTKPFDSINEKITMLEKIYNIILETNNFNDTENKIRELLFPQVQNIQYNSNWRVYELGAWKISPQYNTFSEKPGKFVSHASDGYSFSNAPLQAILTTKDWLPEQTSAEYFITDENEDKLVPILPINRKNRKETDRFKVYPLMFKSPKVKPDYNILELDFPSHANSRPFALLFENGKSRLFDTSYNEIVEFYNSRLLYFNGLKYNSKNVYTINYFPTKIEVVEVWILKPNNNLFDSTPHDYDFSGIAASGEDANLYLDHAVTFPTEATANEFLFQFDKILSDTYLNGTKNMQKGYTPVKVYCHLDEFNSWFNNGRFPLFVDQAMIDNFSTAFNSVLGTAPYTLKRDDFNEIRYNARYTRSSWIIKESLNNTFRPPSFGGLIENWISLEPSIMIY